MRTKLLVVPLLASAVAACGSMDEAGFRAVGNQVVRIESFHTCDRCPAYELTYLNDGTNYFLGKDAVRRLGTNGSAVFRDEQLAKDKQAKEVGIEPYPLTWLIPLQQNLEAVLADIATLIDRRGSLKTIAHEEGIDRPPPAAYRKLLLEIRLPDHASEEVVFYESHPDSSTLAKLVDRLESLHQFPGDLLPVTTFYADKSAILRLERISKVLTRGPNCWGEPSTDIVVTLFENRKLVVEGYRYNVPDDHPGWQKEMEKPILLFLEPPPKVAPYSRVEGVVPSRLFEQLVHLASMQGGSMQAASIKYKKDLANQPPIPADSVRGPEYSESPTVRLKEGALIRTFKWQEIDLLYPDVSKVLNEFKQFAEDLLPSKSKETQDFCDAQARRGIHPF